MALTAISEHEAVQEAHDRLVELRARKADLEEEFCAARFGREPDVDELADAVFAGGEATATKTRPAAEVQKELRAARLAITRAKTALSSAKQRAREEILEELRPDYRRSQRKLARLIRTLLREAEAERAIREQAREAGLSPAASGYFNPLPEAKLRHWLDQAE